MLDNSGVELHKFFCNSKVIKMCIYVKMVCHMLLWGLLFFSLFRCVNIVVLFFLYIGIPHLQSKTL